MRHQHFLTVLAVGGALSGVSLQAQFTPIPVTPDSYNHDLVVEATALRARSLGATTASLDAGTNNTAASFYERGYNLAAPATGLPVAGTFLASDTFPDHSFALPANYAAANALLLDTNISAGTLTVTTPRALGAISFLTSAGGGSPTLDYTLHFSDGSSEAGTFTSPDWFGAADVATVLNGRVNVGSGAFESVDSGNPKLFSVDVPVANSASPLTRIELGATQAGTAHAAILAVSGAAAVGGEFTPLAITGFNHDIVVEAGAYRPPASLNATTASMDQGALNTEFSWYERGYNTNAASVGSGIPAANTVLTNVSAADHIYALAPSYAANNALLVDFESFGTFRPATPRAYPALSFLASAGHGPATASFTITHADGSSQIGSLAVPDWYNGANPAWISTGRVNVASGALDTAGGANPRLYSVDVAVDNKTSPINSIDLAFETGAADAHIVFLAVSGASGNGAPTLVTHPTAVSVTQGGSALLSITATGALPLSFRWQRLVGEAWVDVANGGNFSGATTATLSVSNASFAEEGSYRAVVSNGSGSVTSFEGRITVLSTATDVTAATDLIELAGGTAPENEAVGLAIDDSTSKHLNFGADGNTTAPFTGPVGLIVTPALGAEGSGTTVNAVRVYTANDAEERDPVNFTLEGSNDGTTFTLISSNRLTLPSLRNAAALPLEPLAQGVGEARFSNSTPYKSYRLLFHDVKNNTASSSVQIGEIELLGTVGGNVAALTIARGAANSLTITSSQPGTLQSTATLQTTGTVWTNEGAINGSVTVNTTGNARFFRVLVQ